MIAKLYHDELRECPVCQEYVHVDSLGRTTATEAYRQDLRIANGRAHRCPPPSERRKK